jgi:mono/diheme cytochrome c family protein
MTATEALGARHRRIGWGALVVLALGAGCGAVAPPEPGSPAPATTARADAVEQWLATATDSACERRHPGAGAERMGEARQGSTVSLVHAAGRLLAYAADEDARALLTFDVDGGRALAVTPLGGRPAQSLVLADGRVAVALRDKNRLLILEPAADPSSPLSPLCTRVTEVEPWGLAATPDDQTLLVTAAWSHRLAAFDARGMELRWSLPLAREPRTVLADEDGRRAYVAHVVGGRMSVVDLASRSARLVDLRLEGARRSFKHRDGSMREACQGFALAKAKVAEVAPADPGPRARRSGNADERPTLDLTAPPPPVSRSRLFVPHVTVEPGDPSRTSSGYGNPRFERLEHPVVAVVDTAAERSLTRQLVTVGAEPVGASTTACLLPRASAVDEARGGLLVGCLGIDSVVELDARAVDPARVERRRWNVPPGPTGLALDGADRAVVWSQFARRLTVLDLSDRESAVSIPAPAAAKSQLPPRLARGRALFHLTGDRRIAVDGRACASCHPDGREDALTWPTPVGPRQTILLAGRVAGTAPYSWLGNHATVKEHLTQTFQRLGGTGLRDTPADDDAIDDLVAWLEAMPGPTLEGGWTEPRERALAERGRTLFHAAETGCASCHTPGGAADARKHDVGSGAAFDTPSLRFVGGSAPYFHDGRYGSLVDLLAAPDASMGHSLHLTRDEVEALAAYLETL